MALHSFGLTNRHWNFDTFIIKRSGLGHALGQQRDNPNVSLKLTISVFGSYNISQREAKHENHLFLPPLQSGFIQSMIKLMI